MDSHTLDTILYFYRNHIWPNMYLYENRIDFRWENQTMTNFNDICDFLLLPCDNIEDIIPLTGYEEYDEEEKEFFKSLAEDEDEDEDENQDYYYDN